MWQILSSASLDGLCCPFPYTVSDRSHTGSFHTSIRCQLPHPDVLFLRFPTGAYSFLGSLEYLFFVEWVLVFLPLLILWVLAGAHVPLVQIPGIMLLLSVSIGSDISQTRMNITCSQITYHLKLQFALFGTELFLRLHLAVYTIMMRTFCCTQDLQGQVTTKTIVLWFSVLAKGTPKSSHSEWI